MPASVTLRSRPAPGRLDAARPRSRSRPASSGRGPCPSAPRGPAGPGSSAGRGRGSPHRASRAQGLSVRLPQGPPRERLTEAVAGRPTEAYAARLAALAGHGGEARLGEQQGCLGEACAILADLSQEDGGQDRTDAGEAAEELAVGMLGEEPGDALVVGLPRTGKLLQQVGVMASGEALAGGRSPALQRAGWRAGARPAPRERPGRCSCCAPGSAPCAARRPELPAPASGSRGRRRAPPCGRGARRVVLRRGGSFPGWRGAGSVRAYARRRCVPGPG